ncbi:MAG: porin PorA family protein, partial [Dietzia cercidiphylli]
MARQSSSAGRRSSVPALVLVGLGAFLITIALALVFFVVPAQKKTPLDINTTTVTETTQGAVLVGAALAGNSPTELNSTRPECSEGDEDADAPGDGAAGDDEVVETQDGAEADDADLSEWHWLMRHK